MLEYGGWYNSVVIGYNLSYNYGMDVKVRKIGNGYGVLLPKQFLDEAGLNEGAMINIEKVAGVYQMKPVDEQFTRQVEAFLRSESRHRNTYRELAK